MRKREQSSLNGASGTDEDLYLSETLFLEFSSFLHHQIGKYFVDGHRQHVGAYVMRRVVATGQNDPASYLKFIKNGSAESDREIDALIDQVTCQITNFFRHPQQFESFREIASNIVNRRRKAARPGLKVWTTACATGQEAYSLAMILHELGCTKKNWNVVVKGTDVCRAAIERARLATYPSQQIWAAPEPYRSRHFVVSGQAPDQVVIAPQVRQLVDFSVLNLTDVDRLKSIRNMDVIFCRNVLLYFDNPTKKAVVSSLWQCLRPGGYLILGPCDGIKGLGEIFQRTPQSRRLLNELTASSWLYPAYGA